MDFVTRTLSVFMIITVSGGYTKSPEKVFGGALAHNLEFPHQVSLRAKGEHFCGGSIIDEFHVLTAASCVILEPGVFRANIEILSGTADLFDTFQGNLYSVSHMAIHEDYDPVNFWINDIAVLTLTGPITFSPWCGWISLPDSLSEGSDGLIVIGWGGKISPTGRPLKNLHKVNVEKLNHSECDSYYENFRSLDPNQGCIQIMNRKKYTAISKGDGGGPIIVLPRRQILGIISVSDLDSRIPSLYTEVHPYEQWIIDAMVY